MLNIIQGDCIERLKLLPADSVHCVVTSVPYHGLRDYGTGTWDGGDPACDHRKADIRMRNNLAAAANACDGGNRSQGNRADNDLGIPYADVCGKCGAKRIDKQIGLEKTLEEWCAKLVDVFREVRRVLHPSGTLWLNIGDSYAANRSYQVADSKWCDVGNHAGSKVPAGMKPKDLVGQPWTLAFALRADGWWLRQEIIWEKPNPMPESVTDRCTKSHEQIFLLTKEPRYFFDAEAIKEPVTGGAHMRCDGKNSRMSVERAAGKENSKLNPSRYSRLPGVTPKSEDIERGTGIKANNDFHSAMVNLVGNRNKRSVWTIATESYSEGHFATFPTDLVKPCVLSGTSARGVCPRCLSPWERIVENGAPNLEHQRACGGNEDGEYFGQSTKDYASAKAQDASATKARILAGMVEKKTVGWEPTCQCGSCDRCGEDAKHGLCEGARVKPFDPIPATVLDPFLGSGTTAAVALELGRAAVGIELNEEYVELARQRCAAVTPGLVLA